MEDVPVEVSCSSLYDEVSMELRGSRFYPKGSNVVPLGQLTCVVSVKSPSLTGEF